MKNNIQKGDYVWLKKGVFAFGNHPIDRPICVVHCVEGNLVTCKYSSKDGIQTLIAASDELSKVLSKSSVNEVFFNG